MKAVFPAQDSVSIKDIPEPVIGDKDILVKMRACGLCGSDIEKVYGNYGVVSRRLGHEPAGEVIAVGKSVRDLKVRDRVFVHHHVPCYECHYCKHKDYTMCMYYQQSNIEPCGLAEEFLVPEWNISRGGVIKLPDHVTFEEAAMIEPLACCIRAIEKAEIMQGDSVAIIGVGPAGMMHLMLSKAYGAKTYAIDVNDFRLKFAENNGADVVINAASEDPQKIVMQGIGVDTVIVSTGSVSAFKSALNIVRRGGRIILFGVPSKGAKVELDLNHIFTNEIRVVPSLAASEYETRKAFELISNKKLDISRLITHKFKLEDSMEAIRCAHEAKNAMKVVVVNI